MNTHDLKTWPEFFDAVVRGDKTFEIRRDDRAFKVGDRLRLREFDPTPTKGFTGRVVEADVTYKTKWEQQPGFCVLAIRLVQGFFT